MYTTANTEHQSPAGKSATERRDCRHWAIALLVVVILALMHGAALAVPAWLLAVPFLLLGWVEVEGDLMAGSGIPNRESAHAATVKAAAGSVLFHAVLAAVVIVAHGRVAERIGMRGAGCGCGAKSGATFQVAGASNGQAGSLPHSGCG